MAGGTEETRQHETRWGDKIQPLEPPVFHGDIRNGLGNRNEKELRLEENQETKVPQKLKFGALAGMAQLVGCHPTDQKVEGSIPVRTCAWVAGSVPSEACTRGNGWMSLTHINRSLSLSPSLPLFLE